MLDNMILFVMIGRDGSNYIEGYLFCPLRTWHRKNVQKRSVLEGFYVFFSISVS
jgi:hypothetical protein